MDSLIKNLQAPEYVHVLINHLPLTGLFVALAGLVGALVMRDRGAVLFGMMLVSLVALSAWPVYEYGEDGFDRVLSMADDEGGAYLKRHRELAERWVWLFYVTAGLGTAGTVVGWKRPKWLRGAAITVAVFALSSLVAGAVIAECGGKVRHREFRTGPPPAEEQSNAGGARGQAARPSPFPARAGSLSRGLTLSSRAPPW